MGIRLFERDKSLDSSNRHILFSSLLKNEEKNEIINFCVIQFYIDRSGKKNPVIMHDFSHGCYNTHRYYLESSTRKEDFSVSISVELFEKAKQDIREKWSKYVLAFLIRRMPDELRGEH